MKKRLRHRARVIGIPFVFTVMTGLLAKNPEE
jgi:hypothetical protein